MHKWNGIYELYNDTERFNFGIRISVISNKLLNQWAETRLLHFDVIRENLKRSHFIDNQITIYNKYFHGIQI